MIPADNKWFTRVAVAAAIVETLEDLKLAYPQVDAAERKQLQARTGDARGKEESLKSVSKDCASTRRTCGSQSCHFRLRVLHTFRETIPGGTLKFPFSPG